MQPIPIFITTFQRQQFTAEMLKYLKERTEYPYKLFIIDNGGNEEFRDQVDYYVTFGDNIGIHAAWNVALALADHEYFITTDNDLLVPKLSPCWLTQLTSIIEKNPDYGAISLHPHVFIGAAGIDPNSAHEVEERNMCGAVLRILRRSAVMEAGGWDNKIEAGRNHEERTICSRLQTKGWKVGITPRLRAYHNFGENWGYDKEFTPEMQKHTPELKDYVLQFDHREPYDNDTWLPKK